MTRISDTQTPEAAITRFVARFDPAEIPAQVLAEGRRSLVNIFATAFTGCDEAPIAAMRKTGLAFSSSSCTVRTLVTALVNTASLAVHHTVQTEAAQFRQSEAANNGLRARTAPMFPT